MKGSVLMGGMLGFSAVFAGALWYFQNYAYYEVSKPTDFDLSLTLVDGGEEVLLANGFEVLTADTSPLKFRACFQVENSLPMLTETYAAYENATPLQPPSWFECFNTREITEALESGEALAFLAKKNIAEGVDRVVAIYSDGRAFAWHQLNEQFAE